MKSQSLLFLGGVLAGSRCTRVCLRSLFYSEHRRRWTQANVSLQPGKSNVVEDVTFVPVKRRSFVPVIYRSQHTTEFLRLFGTRRMHRAFSLLSPSLSLFLVCCFSLILENFHSILVFHSYIYIYIYVFLLLYQTHFVLVLLDTAIVTFLAFSHSLFRKRIVRGSLYLFIRKTWRDFARQHSCAGPRQLNLPHSVPILVCAHCRSRYACRRYVHMCICTYTLSRTGCMCATHFSQSGVTAHFSYPKRARLWNTSDVT